MAKATLSSVVIVGRPNVGKSTLFNRICGRRRALVGNEPGMTRDRIHAPADWHGRRFEIVDTGGIVPESRELMASEILRQARTAMDRAVLVILVVDGREGVQPVDEEIAQLLRRATRRVVLAVNKVDSLDRVFLTADFERLGIHGVFPVSAEHGFGVDDLVANVTATLAPSEGEGPNADPSPRVECEMPLDEDDEAALLAESNSKDTAADVIHVAIIGRPNVGKSTLLNRLAGEDRSIVTPMPGTTRDAVDASFERAGRQFRIVDTAGIRRKGKTRLLAEKLSVIQARKHLERAHVALVMLDATEGATAADAHIAGYAHESGRSVVLVVNKWDAVARGSKAMNEFTEKLRRRMKFLAYAPIAFISALEGRGLEKLVDMIAQVSEARRLRVSAADLRRFNESLDPDRAPSPAGRRPRIFYIAQAGVAPPVFTVFTNRREKLHFSLERYIENRLRDRFGFGGTPIIIKTRASHK